MSRINRKPINSESATSKTSKNTKNNAKYYNYVFLRIKTKIKKKKNTANYRLVALIYNIDHTVVLN